MTGATNNIAARVAVIMFAIGMLFAGYPIIHPALAQDGTGTESLSTEEPHDEPTFWSPITAGDAERGAPVPSPEVAASPMAEATPAESSVSAESASPAESPSPEAASEATPETEPTASASTSISREGGSRSGKKGAPKSSAKAAAGGTATKATAGAGGIVPDNSPFASMNFANSKGPTNINSESMNLDYKDKAILFTGHVHAVQGAGDLTSDTLKVQYGKDFNDIQMMYADGNVRMSQGTRWITSDHAVLDQGKHIVTFRGNPVAHDGEDQITGSVIAVDLVTGKSTVQKPRVIIFPRESKNPDNVKAADNP